MRFIQYYLDCLSHASYLIGDETTGRAVVVDPQRDVAEYLADAQQHGLSIELVVETHFHADFVSGHLELADATGAAIAYSSVADTQFASTAVEDGDRYALGDVVLEFRHTPGHTPESMSVVVFEHADAVAPYGVLTGDTLFIGDVGRPDLLASAGFTGDQLAGMLYDSIQAKLLTLPDATRVFPAHGAGSACGKNLSTERSSTIGEQRRTNYALRTTDRDAFVQLVTEGQPPAPGYFSYDAALNGLQRELLAEAEPPAPITYDEVHAATATGAVLLDGRGPEEFARGHLRGSINVGLDGRYAQFAGSVLRPDVDVVLIVEPGQEREAKNRLARIGFDRVIGHLADPDRAMIEHPGDVEVASRLTADALQRRIADGAGVQLVDVRNPGETADGVIQGALTIPVGEMPDRIGELDLTAPTVVYCAGGYRSSVAASVLRRYGATDVSDVLGGFGAWQETCAAAESAAQ